MFTHNPIDETNKFPGSVRTQRYRLVKEIKGPAGGSSAKASDDTAKAWQLYDMQNDPGQKDNIAAANSDIVRELSTRYDDWFTDISSEGLQRFPLPIGHSQNNPVELHAPQAFYDKPLHFANGPGFANDWLTGWTTKDAKVWFEIEVLNSGKYDIELAIGCPKHEAGSQIQISVGDQTLSAVVPECDAIEIPLPHRDERGKTRYRNRNWSTLNVGTLSLPKGPATLTIQPLNKAGNEVMDLKHVELRLRTQP